MRTLSLFSFVLLSLMLAGCGSGGGGGSSSDDDEDDDDTTPPPPAYVQKFGDLLEFSRDGVFIGPEEDTEVRVYTGDRLGEVSFFSHALNRTMTGRDGDTVTDDGNTFELGYSTDSGHLSLTGSTGECVWQILDEAPIPRGDG